MQVVLEEECLRDGLQAQDRLFNLSEKMELIGLLAQAGVRRLQVGSFVNPRVAPQVANTDVLASLVQQRFPDILCTALVVNERGLRRALRSGLKHLSVAMSVSEKHSRKNIGCPVAEAMESTEALVRTAVAAGVYVRAGILCAFGSEDENTINETVVMEAANRLAWAGAAEISLADTMGLAGPFQVRQMVQQVTSVLPQVALSLHFHNNRGLGLVNIFAAYEAGVRIFDVAAAGLGGGISAEDSPSNVATEEAVYLLNSMGVDTGIDLSLYRHVVDYFADRLNEPMPCQLLKSLRPGGRIGG